MKTVLPDNSLRRTVRPVLGVLIVTALLYGHTLQVPFYLDDNALFNGTYLLRDLAAASRSLFTSRGLTNLSFAINYRLTGWELPPLHLVNIFLHAGCGILVWLLLRRLITGRRSALLGALLFLAHPLQTQGVTYLAQRATVLGAFFFLLAFLCYRQARERLAMGQPRGSRQFLLPYGAAVIAGACAVLAKENTAVLPLALFAHDRLFPLPAKAEGKRSCLDYLPFCLAPLLLGLTALAAQFAERAGGFSHYPLESLQNNDPLHYLVTQFSVVWVYLRLLVFPVGQALEHNYPVVAKLPTLQNGVALAGLLMLWGLTWRVRRRRPLLTFGVVWFFLGLAVESSIIPLDPLFEHRLYLPMFGFVLVLLDGMTALLGDRRAALVLGAGLLILMPLTWQRNALWNNPIAFYEDNLRTIPGSERAMIDLAFRYRAAGRDADQRQLLEEALRLHPMNHEFYATLAEIRSESEGLQPALALLEEGLRRLPESLELYETAALVAERHGMRPLIFAYLERGLASVKAGRWRLLNDLGIYYAQEGAVTRAEAVYRESLALRADNPAACQYLAALYYEQGRFPEAFALLKTAQRIEPGNPKTLEGLWKVARQLGDVETARWAEAKLQQAMIGEPAQQPGVNGRI